MDKQRYRPPELNRDHARPRTAPAPGSEAVEAWLTELIRPATYALVERYRGMGLRWRTLTLPVMAALVLGIIWRQVSSITDAARLLSRESVLWAPPTRVSQQALSQRLRCLPWELYAELLDAVLPRLRERSGLRERPVPAAVARALAHFPRLLVADATTLEAVFKRVGALRDVPGTVLGGKLMGLLDLPSKLPVGLWLDEDADVNEKSFLDRLEPALPERALLVVDKGFYSFALFDWLTEHRRFFLTRARSLAAFDVAGALVDAPAVRDRIIVLGKYRSNPCRHPVRLVEVRVGNNWHGYLTNVLDPTVLSAADVADLYGRRWRIEEAFLLVKRLLGLSYLWTGAANGIRMQVWATWLLYSALIDLSDAVAEELDQPLDRISVEMVYRGLYHFTVAHSRGEATDPVAYLAAQPDLGILKRKRMHTQRQHLDPPLHYLIL